MSFPLRVSSDSIDVRRKDASALLAISIAIRLPFSKANMLICASVHRRTKHQKTKLGCPFVLRGGKVRIDEELEDPPGSSTARQAFQVRDRQRGKEQAHVQVHRTNGSQHKHNPRVQAPKALYYRIPVNRAIISTLPIRCERAVSDCALVPAPKYAGHNRKAVERLALQLVRNRR